MIWIIAYSAVMIGIGVFQFIQNKSRSVEDFIAYGRKAGAFSVAMSLVALVFGASSVFGLAGYSINFGFNAVWWTLSGAIFLIILALTFSNTVYSTKGLNLSDIIAKFFGENIRFLVSFIILIAWMMVLAGQIIAGGNILDLFLHNKILSFAAFTALFAFYSLLVGQAGAMKSGLLQVVLMMVGIVILCVTAFLQPQADIRTLNFSLGFDSKFTPALFLSVFIPVGLSYLFGPDMYSRIFTAKDAKSARNGLLIGAVITALLCVVIVLTGMAGIKILGSVAKPDNIIPLLVQKLLSGPLANLVLLALVSIPLSGADIMLVNMGNLLGKDLITGGLNRVKVKPSEPAQINIIRLSMLIIAVMAVITALNMGGIIKSLLTAYTIFSIGIVPMVFVSLISIRFGLPALSVSRKVLSAVYLVAVTVFVILTQSGIVKIGLVNYSLYLILLNTLVLSGIGMMPGKEKV